MHERRSPLLRRLAVVLVAAVLAWWGTHEQAAEPPPTPSVVSSPPQQSGDPLLAALLARSSKVQIESAGIVKKLLPDDDTGSRHQRFLLEGPSGGTVLVAHNLDLAPRVPDLKPGARVAFSGEYEWNERGGVIHWTHHDPRGEHAGGWIEYRGRRYQ